MVLIGLATNMDNPIENLFYAMKAHGNFEEYETYEDYKADKWGIPKKNPEEKQAFDFAQEQGIKTEPDENTAFNNWFKSLPENEQQDFNKAFGK